MSEEELLPHAFTADTLAQRWRVSSTTIRTLVRAKKLPAFKVGRQIRIRAQDVLAFEQGSANEVSLRASTPPRPEPRFEPVIFRKLSDR